MYNVQKTESANNARRLYVIVRSIFNIYLLFYTEKASLDI